MPKKPEKKVPVRPLTKTEKAADTKYKKDFAGSAGRPISTPPPKKKKKKKVKRSEALKKGPKAPTRTDTIRPDVAVHLVVKAPSFGPYTHSTKIGRVAESKTRMAKAKTQAKVKPLVRQRSKVKSARKEGRKGVTSAIQTSSSRFDAAPKIGRAVKTTMGKTGRSAQLRARLKRRAGVKKAFKTSSNIGVFGPSTSGATRKVIKEQKQFKTAKQKRRSK